MKKSTKSAAKMSVAVEVKAEPLPKKLPIGVAEMGFVKITGGKLILVAKGAKSFNWRKSDKETIRFDLKNGKSSKDGLSVEVKTFKRDDNATMKALEAHRKMKLEAQQRYLSKQK